LVRLIIEKSQAIRRGTLASVWQKRRAMHHLAACGATPNTIGTFYAKTSIEAFTVVAIIGAAWHNESLAESYR